jgi:hypothetical protein
MDTTLLVFCIIGVIMFAGYLGLIYYTSYKDYHKKKEKV